MRVFDKQKRIKLAEIEERELFQRELEYYRENNQYPVKLFGKDIVNIYKNINLQVLVNKSCPAKCGFCIENDGQVGQDKEMLMESLSRVLGMYRVQGITPRVTMTGGEPTLDVKFLSQLLDVTKECPTNVNTNGWSLGYQKNWPLVVTNLSKHYWDERTANLIFGVEIPKHGFEENTFLQCVMMKDFVGSIPKMKRYMWSFPNAKGFSFRGLSTLDTQKPYRHEIGFTERNWVPMLWVMDCVANDLDFEFVQQKIGDHYVYEVYRFNGKPVRLTYSNFALLREWEAKERGEGKVYSRATIVDPRGCVFSGWAFDLNKVFDPKW